MEKVNGFKITTEQMAKVEPYFDEIMKGNEKLGLPQIAFRVKINYSKVLSMFSVYIRNYKRKQIGIKAVFKMPDGNIETYSTENEIMSGLCGSYSPMLYEKIRKMSDENTKWNGFD